MPDPFVVAVPNAGGILGWRRNRAFAVIHGNDGIGRSRQGGNLNPGNQITAGAVKVLDLVGQLGAPLIFENNVIPVGIRHMGTQIAVTCNIDEQRILGMGGGTAHLGAVDGDLFLIGILGPGW